MLIGCLSVGCARVSGGGAPDAAPPDAGTPGFKFPQDCGTTLNKGEETLAFLFFDLALCVQKDTMPEIPPIIIP